MITTKETDKQRGNIVPILSKSSPPLAYSRKRYSVDPLRLCPKNLITLS